MPKWIVRLDGAGVHLHVSRKHIVVVKCSRDCEPGCETEFDTWEAADRAAQGVRLLHGEAKVTVHPVIPDELGSPLSAAELARAAGPESVPMAPGEHAA